MKEDYPKKIRTFDLQFDDGFRKKFHKGCKQILDEGFITNHTFVKEFEKEFSEFNHSNYAVAVSNGTSAIECALRAIGVEGKKVLMPTNTFIATAVAAINAGAEPVFLDVEEDYFSLSPEKLKEALDKYNSGVGAIVHVHIGSHISPSILENEKICRQKGISLVEDCAQGLGAKLNGINAGNFGAYGCFSFFMTKVLTTGEGGMVITKNKENYNKLRSIRQFGMDLDNSISHVRDGGNFKITEFQALMGILELERVQKRIQKRRELAKKYQELLKDTSFITIKDKRNTYGSYYKQIIISPKIKRQIIEEEFNKNGIPITGGVYYIPLHRQQVFKGKFSDENFSVANKFCKNHFCPPCYPELELKDIERICGILKEIDKNLIKSGNKKIIK